MTTPTPGTSAADQLLGEAGTTGTTTSTDTKDPIVPSLTGLGRQGWGVASNSLLDAGKPRVGLGEQQADRVTNRKMSDVALDAQRMTDGELDALAKRLQDAGLLPRNTVPSREDIEGAWTDLVGKAAKYKIANPDSNLTPEDMIDLYGGQRLLDSKQTAPTLATAEGARTMLTSMMSTSLGRDPTQKEADDFQAALNSALANPSLAPDASYVDPASGKLTLNPSDFQDEYKREHLQGSDEYAHFQAATTYYKQLLDTIKSPTPLTTLGNR